MPSPFRNSISSHLNIARLAINNTAANPRIKELVAARGYTVDTMAEGQRLYLQAVHAVDAQAAAAGAQRSASEHARVCEQQARMAYQNLAQTVRAVFPLGSSQRKALDVKGAMPDVTDAFVTVATTLYNNALSISEIGVVLAKYGYDTPTLHQERDMVVAYQHALHEQVLAKTAAKEATRTQLEAMIQLRRWTAQYHKIARIALRDQPNLLQALGIAPLNKRAKEQPTK